jgi:5-methylcytosine-specific restriction protein A
MGVKPRRYCLAWPCKNLAVPGSAYCPAHQPARAPKQADDFYLSTRWRRFRDWYIGCNPFCQHCQADGHIVKATIVDHVVERVDGGAPFDADNAQSLCAACHNRKTKLEQKRRKSLKNHREPSPENRRGSRIVS